MNKANKITMSRVIMSIIIIVLLLFPFDQMGIDFPTYLIGGKILIDLKYIIVGVLFIIASFTDFLDGYLARKHNLVTDFGKFMDPLADKVLVVAALLFLVQIGRIESWAVLIIVTREYAISIIRAIAATNGKVIAASGGGKIKTVLQMVSIIMLLLSLPFANIVFYISVVMTLYSGIQYIWSNRALIEER